MNLEHMTSQKPTSLQSLEHRYSLSSKIIWNKQANDLIQQAPD